MSVKKSPDMVVGGVRIRRFSFAALFARLRTLKGVISVIGVLAVIAIGLLVLPGVFSHHTAPAPRATPTQAPSRHVKPVSVTYTQMSNQDLTNKVNYLIGTQQYSEAEKLIKTQDNYQSDSVKLNLLKTVQTAANDTSGAEQTSQQIASLPAENTSAGSPSVYESTADQYAASGDKTKALEYYNKALAAYKARNLGSDPDSVVRVQNRIKELQ